MTDVETIQTPYGEVEFQTVECDSCGESIRKENAQRFLIGDIHRTRTKFNRRVVHFKKDCNPVVGWCCEYCRDAGPIDYPYLTVPDRVKRALKWYFYDSHGLLSARGILTIAIGLAIVLTAIGSFLA